MELRALEDEYLDLFISELDENVKILNDSLLLLEKNRKNLDALAEVMRAAHTVKGMAGTMGYDSLSKLTHATESKIIELQKSGVVTSELIQVLYQVADRMGRFAQSLEAGEDINKIPVDDLIGFLNKYDPQSAELSDVESAISEEDEIKLGTKYSVKVIFEKNTALRGARGFQLLQALDRIAMIEDSSPPRNVIEEGKLVDDPTFTIVTNEDENQIRNTIASVSDIAKIEISRLVEEAVSSIPIVSVQRGIQSVRVNLNQLDSVVDLLGELVLARNRLALALSDVLTPSAVEQLNIFESTITAIQDRLMRMRMVNLSRIFDTYPRTVRDIAAQRNMEIELLLQGTHLELDRSVIDQVNEALLHLIRNAAIHGIEDKNTRKKMGKPEKGTIRVSAVQDRGEVVFNVEDDGSGLDLEAIKKKGIEKGLLKPSKTFHRKQLAALIFHPGFSTAGEVTTAAGRGVGMDIVKRTIEEINGSIEIRTKKGKGTLFIIRVPQTLAIIQALIIRVKEYLFAIPMLNIEKIFSINDEEVKMREGRYYLELGEHVIPVIDLEENIDFPAQMKIDLLGTRRRIREGKPKVILWEKGGSRVCLKVSDVMEQREIVTKALDSIAQQYRGFSGATILDEDKVVLILDPATI